MMNMLKYIYRRISQGIAGGGEFCLGFLKNKIYITSYSEFKIVNKMKSFVESEILKFKIF